MTPPGSRPSRIGLLANPQAGGRAWLQQAMPRLAALGPLYVTRHPKDLQPALQELRRADVDLLVVVGGDGTLHTVLGSLLEVWREPPLLYPIHAGTAGLVHHSLALPSREGSLVELEAVARGERRLAQANVPTLRLGDRLVFNVGAGLPRHSARARGRMAAGALFARLVTSALVDGPFARRLLAPWRGEISVDGGPARAVSSSILYGSALDRLGPMRGWRQIAQPDGHFRWLQVPEQGARELLRRVPAFAMGDAQGKVASVRTVRLSASAPFVYVADGEPYTARELEVRRGPSLGVARALSQAESASTTSSAVRVDEEGFWPVTSFPSRTA